MDCEALSAGYKVFRYFLLRIRLENGFRAEEKYLPQCRCAPREFGIGYYVRKPVTWEDSLAAILKTLPPALPRSAAREERKTPQLFSQFDDFLSLPRLPGLGRVGVFQLLVGHRFLQDRFKQFRHFGAPNQYLPNLHTRAKE
jgi:hypothetical protein